MKKMILISTLAALAVTAAVLAQAPWGNPAVAKELGLSPQQQQQLTDLRFKHQKEMIDLRRDLELKELALKEEMSKDQPNESAIERAIDSASQAKAAMAKARFRHMQEARAILTPEQWQKARAWMQAHRGQFRNGRGGHGWGMQRGGAGQGMGQGRGMGPCGGGFVPPQQQGGAPAPDEPPPPPAE